MFEGVKFLSSKSKTHPRTRPSWAKEGRPDHLCWLVPFRSCRPPTSAAIGRASTTSYEHEKQRATGPSAPVWMDGVAPLDSRRARPAGGAGAVSERLRLARTCLA